MASFVSLTSSPWRVLIYVGLCIVLAFFLFVDFDIRPSSSSPSSPRMPGEPPHSSRFRLKPKQPFQQFVRSLKRKKAKFHVFCYGDSLTNGNHQDDRTEGFCPYYTSLQETLNEHSPPSTYDVDSVGWAGKTAAAMVKWHEVGLTLNVKEYKPDLVIIMAGTNDLLHCAHSHPNENRTKRIEDGVNMIVDNLIFLHDTAKENGATHTVAVGMPPAKKHDEEPIAKEIARRIDERLRQVANESGEDDMTFVPFPFPYNKGDRRHWSADGIHPTCTGYEEIGKTLASVVQAILEPEPEE